MERKEFLKRAWGSIDYFAECHPHSILAFSSRFFLEKEEVKFCLIYLTCAEYCGVADGEEKRRWSDPLQKKLLILWWDEKVETMESETVYVEQKKLTNFDELDINDVSVDILKEYTWSTDILIKIRGEVKKIEIEKTSPCEAIERALGRGAYLANKRPDR